MDEDSESPLDDSAVINTRPLHPYRTMPTPIKDKLSWWDRLWCRLGFHLFEMLGDIPGAKRWTGEFTHERYGDGRIPIVTVIPTEKRCRRCRIVREDSRCEYDRPNVFHIDY